MFDDLNDLYQQVILDHSRAPRNFRTMDGATGESEGHNPLCGDNVRIYVRLAEGRVQDISFQGSGCAISKASASLMTDALRGKTLAEVKAAFETVHGLVTTGHSGGGDLGKLAVFAGVHKFPARVKCAILPWHAALAAVEGKQTAVSTE